MTALPVSKCILVCRLFLAHLVPNSLIFFKKEHPTACHPFSDAGGDHLAVCSLVSYLVQFLAVSGLPVPLLSQSCFLEIVYQKIAAEQLSFDCSFLFFISSTPSPYLSFISSPLLDFFLCFARGSFFATRKSGPSRYICLLDMCRSGDAHTT